MTPFRAVGAFCAVALSTLALTTTGNPVSADPTVATTAAQSPIKHVVVIYQENHTFDDVLGAVCESRTVPCNGYTGPVTFADGKTATNYVQLDIVPNIGHT